MMNSTFESFLRAYLSLIRFNKFDFIRLLRAVEGLICQKLYDFRISLNFKVYIYVYLYTSLVKFVQFLKNYI